jgi:hypothetical protein
MYFKDDEVAKMQTIFKRLEPRTVESLQFYAKEYNVRTGYTFVIYNKWKKPIYVFQNFQKLSPFRMKLLMRLSETIPYQIHITEPREDIQCIGWKIA